MDLKVKRTAREIKIDSSLIKNKNINVKVGTVENRDAPETIYIFVSFWARPSVLLKDESQDVLKEVLDTNLSSIYKKELKSYLKNNKYFTSEKDNIYIKNIPENINYNKKRNFISLELYLHTLNIESDKKIPLSNKRNTEIFDEAVKIANLMGNSPLLLDGDEFEIFKKSM